MSREERDMEGTYIIPALEKMRQENLKFKASLDYIVRKKKATKYNHKLFCSEPTKKLLFNLIHKKANIQFNL
jgi:hypothetical protein